MVEVKSKKHFGPLLLKFNELVLNRMMSHFLKGWGDSMLRYQTRLCVSHVYYLRKRVLYKAHASRFSIHPGSTKIYHDLREVYLWDGLKKYIMEFVANCPSYNQVKGERKKSGGLLQEIQIPT